MHHAAAMRSGAMQSNYIRSFRILHYSTLVWLHLKGWSASSEGPHDNWAGFEKLKEEEKKEKMIKIMGCYHASETARKDKVDKILFST